MSVQPKRYMKFLLACVLFFLLTPSMPRASAGEENISAISNRITREQVMSMPGNHDAIHVSDHVSMPPLTTEEERIILHKGTRRPPAPIFAVAAVRHCTDPMTSSTPAAAGPVLMTKFPAQ